MLDVEALYARHREALLGFLVRRTADGEVALDLWAETFAQALAGRHRYRGSSDEEAAAWLFGIARNQLARYYRRGTIEQRALRRLQLERPPVDAALVAEIERRAGMDAMRRELAAALATLSEPVRTAVQLRVVEELPYVDLAARLQISEQAARAGGATSTSSPRRARRCCRRARSCTSWSRRASPRPGPAGRAGR